MADDNASMRSFFRVAGPVSLLVGLALFGSVFFAIGNAQPFSGPPNMIPAFLGIALLAVGGWMTRLGYLGVVARYQAEEVGPAVTVLGQSAHEGWDAAASARCASCGHHLRAGAAFCDQCGARASMPLTPDRP